MLEILIQWDKDLFLFLNGLHHPALDPVMQFITGKLSWIPLYLAIIGFIVYKQKWEGIFTIVAIVLVIVLCDQFASGFCKGFFERFRPCHNPDLQHLVHLVKGCGGKHGFISSHAANTFGLATFLFLSFRKEYSWFTWGFLWAAVVSYSRVYVGVHFPADIILGGLSGIIWASLVFIIFQKIKKRYVHKQLVK